MEKCGPCSIPASVPTYRLQPIPTLYIHRRRAVVKRNLDVLCDNSLVWSCVVETNGRNVASQSALNVVILTPSNPR